ncbi:MAG: CPBP family glutamic-type intramembrane protease [Planctomycetota bacterium]
MQRTRPNALSQGRAILGCELLQLVRDRRALFAAIVLPVLLYPWLFAGQGKIEQMSRQRLAERELQAVSDLRGLSEPWRERIGAILAEAQPITWQEREATPLADLEQAPLTSRADAEGRDEKRREFYRAQMQPGEDLLVVAWGGAEGAPTVALYYDVKNDSSREAQERVERALNALRDQVTAELRNEKLGGDPGAFLALDTHDLATASERSGAKLGRVLPMLLVVLLISGGAFAALTVFAGERESGTLEALLVQPIEPHVLALGKFSAVAVAAGATLAANLGALMLCSALGLGGTTDLGALDTGRVLGAVCYLPGALLLCALLCLALGRSRTFREGQYLLFPLTLLAAVPSAVVLQPGLPNGVLLSMVPFTGAALSLRDMLRGEAQPLYLIVMTVSHLGWTALLVTALARSLRAERALSTADESLRLQRMGPARHGLRWGFAGVLAVYIVGGWLQTRFGMDGLGYTLWLMLLPLGILAAWRGVRARVGGDPETGAVTEELGLGLCSPYHGLAALLLVPAANLLMTALGVWQEEWLPLPRAMQAAAEGTDLFASLSPFMLVFLVGISPGVCEEVYFRGAVLGSLRRGMSKPKAIFWQALFFAAAHASLYRLLPTFLLGLVLGSMRLRARSLWPAMLFHAAYNTLLVVQSKEWVPAPEPGHPTREQFLWAAGMFVAAVALWCLPALRSRTAAKR